MAKRIDSNPARHVYLPSERPAARQPWTPEELGEFQDWNTDDRLAALFELMAFTGLRRGEALGLRWVDVDFEAWRLTVRQQLVDVGRCTVLGRLAHEPFPGNLPGILS